MRSRSHSINFGYLNKLDKYDDEQIIAIDHLIEDIHKEKDLTSKYLINHRNAEKFIQIFINLLSHPNYLLVGNAAFILGTLLEFNIGLDKILKAFSGSVNETGENHLFTRLINLLNSNHSDVVMNTAGTLGTLVESQEGREYFITNLTSFNNFIKLIPKLLLSNNLWTCSNAALIIARLTIDEVGIKHLTESTSLDKIIKNLVGCLGIDSAGKGMNSAFALGRLLDSDVVWNNYWPTINKSCLIENLASMSNSPDLASVKNACFCLSTVISKKTGFQAIVANRRLSDIIVKNFIENLNLNDEETVWFILMTLKSICKYINGILFLRKYPLLKKIQECRNKSVFSSEVTEQCDEIILNIIPLDKPEKPNMESVSSTELRATWTLPSPTRKNVKSNLYYKQNTEEILVYRGTRLEMNINNLTPNTEYEFFLQYTDEIDRSPYSDPYLITTDEDVSTPPINLKILVKTPTQLKVEWDEPDNPNGMINGYFVDINRTESSNKFKQAINKYFPTTNKKDKCTDQTSDTNYIISGLQPETKYTISVCAMNNAGNGEWETIEAYTSNSGTHAPQKVSIIVLGRLEMSLYWSAPEEILGRLFRYEVLMNNSQVIYSGTNNYCKVDGLKPNTEYKFCVVAVTSEGRFESTIHKKKTKIDGYASLIRQPLFPGNRFRRGSKERSDKIDASEGDTAPTNIITNMIRKSKSISIPSMKLRQETPNNQKKSIDNSQLYSSQLSLERVNQNSYNNSYQRKPIKHTKNISYTKQKKTSAILPKPVLKKIHISQPISPQVSVSSSSSPSLSLLSSPSHN